ncbi:MAG: hypothetical protein NWE93_03620 [Candidatus Bathyarchaeota archaeon]|nr:hypothetical protein [Candidatus Bathyarchaeota archaeon]
MTKKITHKLTILASILLLATILSSVAANNLDAQPNPPHNTGAQQSLGSLNITQREMTAEELAQYQSSVGEYNSTDNYNQPVNGYGTGLAPPTQEAWSSIAENAYVIEKISSVYSVSPQVDLSKSAFFPPIGNQGSQGSCTAFAIGYYCKTYQEAKEHNWNLTAAKWTGGYYTGNISLAYQGMVMSPAFVYNLINKGRDKGSSFEDAVNLVCNVGISSWQKMPYYLQDYQRWPSESAWTEAPLYRSNSTYGSHYLYANTPTAIESLKNWLSAGNLAVIAVDATDNLYTLKTNSNLDLITTDTLILGELDHAGTIVGYDDSFNYTEGGVTHYGAFKIANSWGVGSWEDVSDGCYWISYDAMMELSDIGNPVILFQNLDNYQPQLLVAFKITHDSRSQCTITLGLGAPDAAVASKSFSSYILSGSQAFPDSNIVFDITEFLGYMTSQYNQTFFLTVKDSIAPGNGTINYFAVDSVPSNQTPVSILNGQSVSVTVTTSLAEPTLTVSPSSGPAGGDITLIGEGFAGKTVNISYLNPVSQSWVCIDPAFYVSSMNFSFATAAPEVNQNNPAGDGAAQYDSILYRVQDTGDGKAYNSSTPYQMWRRGLLQVANQTASGLFGNGTDFSTAVFVANSQSIDVSGAWFTPGSVTLLWDSAVIGTATVDQTGCFSTSVTVPSTAAGKHLLWVSDGASNVSAAVTRLPVVTDNYVGGWHTEDFPIIVTSDYAAVQTYYRINDGATRSLDVDGQPIINSEGASNKLVYWSFWDVYGSGNRTICNVTLTGIKLDKTAPSATLLINGGASQTTVTNVALTINATDSASGVLEMRFSNDVNFSQTSWEPYNSSRTWQLTSGEGTKTVYLQVRNNAFQTTSVNTSIILQAPDASASPSPTSAPTQSTSTANPTQSPTTNPTSAPTESQPPQPTPSIPEFNTLLLVALGVLVATGMLVILKKPLSTPRLP